MKPIVYATDCSQNSVAALKMGYTLSQKLKATFIVLHVFDVNPPLLTSLSLTHAKKEKKAFDEHRQTLVAFYETHIGEPPAPERVQLIVEENTLVDEAIVNTVTQVEATMVIMGTKGKNPLKDLVIGSTTKAMIKKSPCPVLMVPPVVHAYTLERITYATDFEEADIQAIDWLVKTLALPCKAQLHILHIDTNNEEGTNEDSMPWFKDLLCQKVSYKAIVFKSVHSEEVFNPLSVYPQQEGMDLLVMLEREKPGFLHSLLHADLVQKMLSEGHMPLLSLNKAFMP